MGKGFRKFGKSSGGSGGGGSSNLTSDIDATLNVGGVTIGENFPTGTAIEDVIREIIAPYVNPAFTALTMGVTPSGAEFDVGRTITINQATFAFSLDSLGNPPKNLYITGDGFNKAVTTSPATANPASTAVLTTDSSKTWTISGDNHFDTAIAVRNALLYWRFRMFFGASATVLTGSSTPAEVKAVLDAMQQSALRTGKAWSVTCAAYNDTAGNYTYIAYAAKYGDLAGIIQNGALPVLSAFTKLGSFAYENAYGHTENYNVYKSNADQAFSTGTTLAIT